MLDYYGSIMKTDKDIDTELISRFQEYNENYIECIINELRRKEILPHGPSISISGWLIFVGSYTIHRIQRIITEQTILNKQKLEFMKYIVKNNIDNDIASLICEKIDSKLVIVNDEI